MVSDTASPPAAPVCRRPFHLKIVRALELFADFMIGDNPITLCAPRGPTGLLNALPCISVETPCLPVSRPTLCPHLGGPVGCFCKSTSGKLACVQLNEWASAAFCKVALYASGCVCAVAGSVHCRNSYAHRAVEAAGLDSRNVGTNFTVSDFSGSPQQHAILNRHLMDYFEGRKHAQQTTPYAIPASQQHLLFDLGMEMPQPDAPTVPHGLHKSIEEGQLWRMRNYLAEDQYNLICVKDAKVRCLPKPKSRQNPIRDAKDTSRFPGWAIRDADLTVSKTHFMHDVSSEVTPHELVEKLSKEQPDGHLFVTGMNPAEVLDRVATFEPASHHIQYEGADFNYIFTGSASEAYSTPIDVTLAWLNSSSIVASNGRVYQVALLDEKLGHCLYHIYAGNVSEQATRTFSTGSMVRLPSTVTGTLRPEYIPSKLLTTVLDFVRRTPDLSTRNISAKITQVANAVNPRTTARERWVMWYVVSQLATYKTWDYYLRKVLWTGLYAFTLQWHMLGPMPDIYRYMDERERYRVVKPTQGGGWSRNVGCSSPLAAIPNDPTMLQRFSAFTAAAFVYLWPKLLLGEFISLLFLHVDLWHGIARVVSWFDVRPLRLLLTAAIVVSAAVVPGHVLQYFSSLSGHFWRQLWWPSYFRRMVQLAIVEFSGAPGSVSACAPGRGWSWQLLIWAVAIHSVLPGLVPALVVPWIAFTHGWSLLMSIWLGCVALENIAAACAGPVLFVPERWTTPRHARTWTYLAELPSRIRFGFGMCPVPQKRDLAAPHHFQQPRPFACRRPPTVAAPHVAPPRTVPCGPVPWATPFVSRCVCAVAACVPTFAPTGLSPLLLVRGDISDVCRMLRYSGAHAANVAHRWLFLSQRHLGNCTNIPTLDALPKLVQPTVRRRNVDAVLPTVVVQPNVPVSPVGVQLAIPPVGLNLPDWLAQVTAAYTANPGLHPQLTPGQDCFWQCVASIGGTPHMWFSWYMEFMRQRVPPNQAVVGGVTIPEMHNFATISGIGIRLSGATEEVTLSASDRPTLSILLTNVPMSNDLHATLGTSPPPTGRVQSLAVILRSIRTMFPAWHTAILAEFQNAPVDSSPVPTAVLSGIAGTHDVPHTMAEVADAIQASVVVRPIQQARPDGYNLVAAAPTDFLYTYCSPVAQRNVAHTTPAQMYRSFRLTRKQTPRSTERSANPIPPKVGSSPARQARDNAWRNNARPEHPMWVTLMNELTTKVADYSGLQLPAAGLEEEVVMFTADVHRADRLISDIKANPQVLGGKADARWLQSLASIVDLHRSSGKTVTVPVRTYFGCSGSGKTVATRRYLASLSPAVRSCARVVAHTESLRAQSKLALDFPEMRGVNFPTIPGLLCEPTSGPVVFDDAGKFYGGILDLVLLVNPMIPEVVVNGDPAQALAKFPVGGTQSEYDKGPLVVAELTTKYATVSHRLFSLMTQVCGLHTTSTTRGHITHTVGPKHGLPVTTASPRYVQVLASSGRQAYTHDTIQGEDFSCNVEVDMSALEDAVSDRSAYVALTRSKTGVYLHMNAADPKATVKAPPTGSDFLNAILYTMRAGNSPTLLNGNDLTRATFYSHLHSCMPKLKWFANVGAARGAANVGATLEIGLYQSVTAASNEHFANDGVCVEGDVFDTPSVCDTFVEHHVHETHWHDKESRETSRAGHQTDQFKEGVDGFVNPHVHKRKDFATYKLTVEKRINNATPAANYTRMKKCPRTDMIDEFNRLCPNPPRWTPDKHVMYMDRARTEYEAGRTEAAVLSKLAAHDPDRSGRNVVNSLKAQVIKKEEKRTKQEAIPGQMIYEYDIAQTLEDAAYALFLEDELFPAFPSNFLFYRRMNPAQFKRAYKARWRVGNGVHTSDVTRWDVGCDAGVLNFDVHIFRQVGFPEPYVAAYIDRRLRTSSQHGNLQTSQPSGDRFTWTLNSMRRAVVASLVLTVTPADTVAINGDDEAMDRCADAKPFPDTTWEFKDQNGPTGEFSGFELGGIDPVYSARGIHYRTIILVSRDPYATEQWTNYLSLLEHVDDSSWEALDVARMAERHMPAELFAQALPVAYRQHFPHVTFPVVTSVTAG